MEGFLRSSEFETYRQLILTEIANFISSRLFGSENDLKELRGAIELGRKLIRLPLKINKKGFVKEIVHKDIKTFEANFIRKALEENLIKEEVK